MTEVWVMIAVMLPTGAIAPVQVTQQFKTVVACEAAIKEVKSGFDKSGLSGVVCVRSDKVDAF
jgi:hypothetical protein